ncbi:MAG: amidohydrolase [Rhodobacteraceae bacterium]|nr:amidohydrolase [Paracoccaceae bacterium]
MLLDTHQHLVYPKHAGYSWAAGIPALAKQSFSLEDYAALTIDAVVGTLFMETAVDDADYQAETRFVAGLAADPAHKILGIIASCRPEEDAGYDAWLEECADLPVVGYRRVLHVMEDALSQNDGFRRNIRKLGQNDKTFDMCFLPAQLPIAAELAKACDNTRLILNHCGVPDITGGDIEPWKKGITALAALPNVACKISGLLAYCAPKAANLATIQPYLDHVITAFGADRLVWGSDWPVVNMANGLPDWLHITQEFLTALGADEAEKIRYNNAASIYNLGMDLK